MAGTLTIHSTGAGLLDGHAWIEYTPDGGAATTYGTWGNDPNGLGNGLHENLEAGRTGEATRTMRIDAAGEERLQAIIDQYRTAGAAGWDYLSPCSTFAADAWEAATGETLAHRSGPISHPSRLRRAIEDANTSTGSGTGTGADTPPAKGRRSIDSAVEPCAASSGRGASGSSAYTAGTLSSSVSSGPSAGSSNQGTSGSGSSGPSSAGAPPRSSR